MRKRSGRRNEGQDSSAHEARIKARSLACAPERRIKREDGQRKREREVLGAGNEDVGTGE